jgi:hypothetical protein
MGGGPAPPWQQPEVHGIFHHVGECDNTCDARRADVVYCDGINKIVLDQLLRESFSTQLALFHSQLQVMVDEVFRPLLEEASSCRVCLEHMVGLDPTPHVDPVDEGKTDLYGCFFPSC